MSVGFLLNPTNKKGLLCGNKSGRANARLSEGLTGCCGFLHGAAAARCPDGLDDPTHGTIERVSGEDKGSQDNRTHGLRSYTSARWLFPRTPAFGLRCCSAFPELTSRKRGKKMLIRRHVLRLAAGTATCLLVGVGPITRGNLSEIGYAQLDPPVQGMTMEAWMNEWMSASKVPGGMLRLSRFREPIYLERAPEIRTV